MGEPEVAHLPIKSGSVDAKRLGRLRSVPSVLLKRVEKRRALWVAETLGERARVLRRSAEEFIDRLGQSQGLDLKLAPAALDLLVEMAVARQTPVRELCAELFRDYEFGLRLVKPPATEGPVILPREAVEAPDKFLSDLVVRAYRTNSSDEPTTGPAS